MKTRARRQGDDYILSGTKMWITSSPVAHLALVWARVDDGGPDSIRGFIVERGMPGFETPTIHGKMSLRASPTGEIVLNEVRVPAANMLPGVEGLKGPLSCLTTARFGIACGALGAARACLDTAVAYACERVQFNQPIASKQLIQKQLADMATDIATGMVTWLHFARLKDKKGKLSPTQVSLCKRNNVKVALEAARVARSILGGNGILLEYPVIRHMLNLESVYTYEGTNEVHELILGHALTGLNAF
jgi:glutaryl-CoA dehydrogenase